MPSTPARTDSSVRFRAHGEVIVARAGDTWARRGRGHLWLTRSTASGTRPPRSPSTGGAGDQEVSAVACASPGNCVAAGTLDVSGSVAGLAGTFVVSKVHGRWRKPVVIPGKLAFVYGAWVQSASCQSAGNCAVGGWYGNDLDLDQAFAASEVNGTWHHYINLPGALALPGSGGTQVASLSCPKPGNCTVAGNFIGGAGFLARQVNGAWRNGLALSDHVRIKQVEL